MVCDWAIESTDRKTVSVYYGGNPASHGCDDNHRGPDFSSDNHCGVDGLGKMGRAVYRRDGFVSLEAGYYLWNVPLPSFTTIEMVVPSDKPGGGSDVFLELNLATSVVGHCRIGILADGASIAGFGLQDADPVSGDWLQARASWARAQRSGLKHLVGTVVQLQVEMVDMKLFSVNWVAGPAHAKIVKTDDGVVAATPTSSPRGHDRIGTRRPRKEVGCYWYYLVANGTRVGTPTAPSVDTNRQAPTSISGPSASSMSRTRRVS